MTTDRRSILMDEIDMLNKKIRVANMQDKLMLAMNLEAKVELLQEELDELKQID